MSQETKIEQTENNLFRQTNELIEVLATFEQKATDLKNKHRKSQDSLDREAARFGEYEEERLQEFDNEQIAYSLYIDQVDETFTQNVEEWRKAKFNTYKTEREKLVENAIQKANDAEKYKNSTPEEQYPAKQLKKEARKNAASTKTLHPMHIIANIIGLCLLAWMVYGCVTTSLASEPILNILTNPITWGGLGGMALLTIVMYIWGYSSEYASLTQTRKQRIANYATEATNAEAAANEAHQAIAKWDEAHPDLPHNGNEWLAQVADIKMPRTVAEQLLQNTINSIDPAHEYEDYRFQINYNKQNCI